jgi:hypothetical protein
MICLSFGLFFLPVGATSGDWSIAFNMNRDLDQVHIGDGSYTINNNCELVSNMTGHSSMWINSTGATGSWSYSFNYNSTSSDQVAFYPIVAEDNPVISEDPTAGYFLIFNFALWQEHNKTEFTTVDFMYRDSDTGLHTVGSRDYYHVLNGWQNILITRNNSYSWEVYLNKSLIISPSLGNYTLENDWHHYRTAYSDDFVTSKYSQFNSYGNFKFTHFSYNESVLTPNDANSPDFNNLCEPDVITFTGTTTISNIITELVTTNITSSKSASLTIFPALIGFIIFIWRKRKQNRGNN